ncbi:short-subunit dehydrogenase [Natranaerovirga pectinivora]|uniref:Short-subunit dehydrogenase n=1 Tax=Natranaerovirga pectinivora TaxID=682400 RepID=A0A4R3MPP1_9FIRM|nr:SDR family NAD(P)-dependent oxidoreductase [Natranaerovirga pectinivora]TCT15589.1 short-subunit dehydrogenase [Natranaerovirga pectinivora]
MKKAIVIGASSGIGKELSIILDQNNYRVGLVGRRKELLINLQKELKNTSYIKCLDVSSTEESICKLQELIQEMEGVDLIIISAGCGYINPKLDFEFEKKTIEVNVLGFTAMINAAYNYFNVKGKGHIVGISSIAAFRGSYGEPAYNASKAYVSNYMEGLSIKAKKDKLPIIVTDIKPGFVDTDMAQGEGLFWVAPPRKAALQIYKAIKKEKEHLYVTKRWRLVAWLLKILPKKIYSKL